MPPTPQPIQFGTTLAEPRSGTVSLESVTNLYVEQNPPNAKSPVTLYGTPGLKSWLSSLGDGPIRGIQKMGSSLYVVSGNELYRVDSSKASTLVGTVEGAGNVHMATNGTHVWVAVVGGKLYAANATTILELSQSNMNGVTYQDGYLIGSQSGTEKFWLSGLDDATTINDLDLSTADAYPDTVKGIISDHRELIIFGEDSTEVWYNSGNASFPFERAGGGFIEHGCRAPGSVAKAESAVFFLGSDLTVYMLNGYQAQPISPPWIERLIGTVTDPGSAWGWTYKQQGHTFYQLGFTDLTICYDMTTGLWHRRKSDGIDRWRANCYAKYGETHIVGDYETGDLYELDLDTYDDDGDTIRREVISPPLHAQGSRVICDELYVDMEMGVGLVTGQGSDPTLMLDWTDDGGATWSNELTRSAGAIGEYSRRATWNRLGSFRQRSYRLAISDPVKVAILGAYTRMQPLAA